jgi:hypothetical protein
MRGLDRVLRRLNLLALIVVTVALTTACGTSGLDFRSSSKVRDLQPSDYASTSLPVTISWKAQHLGHGQKYLMLIDQSPMEPGKSVKDIVDDTCAATHGCPDKAYRDAHYMFETTQNRVRVPTVPSAGIYDTDDLTDLHRATIVVLDQTNRRVGEQIWTTEFRVAT